VRKCEKDKMFKKGRESASKIVKSSERKKEREEG
jgi:hypothetical protein